MAAAPVCQFQNQLSSSASAAGAPHAHSHEGQGHSHDHAQEHGHTHEHLDHAGMSRLPPSQLLFCAMTPITSSFMGLPRVLACVSN